MRFRKITALHLAVAKRDVESRTEPTHEVENSFSDLNEFCYSISIVQIAISIAPTRTETFEALSRDCSSIGRPFYLTMLQSGLSLCQGSLAS